MDDPDERPRGPRGQRGVPACDPRTGRGPPPAAPAWGPERVLAHNLRLVVRQVLTALREGTDAGPPATPGTPLPVDVLEDLTQACRDLSAFLNESPAPPARGHPRRPPRLPG